MKGLALAIAVFSTGGIQNWSVELASSDLVISPSFGATTTIQQDCEEEIELRPAIVDEVFAPKANDSICTSVHIGDDNQPICTRELFA